MAYDRRLCPRKTVSWTAQAVLNGDAPLPARVLDVSEGGLRLEIPAGARPARTDLLDVRVRRGFWSLLLRRRHHARGRVVHVSPGRRDGRLEVGVRFHQVQARRPGLIQRLRELLCLAGAAAMPALHPAIGPP